MAGGGFAGVHNTGGSACHGADIAVGRSGNAAHPLHKVQGSALGAQYGGGRPGHAGNVLPGGQVGAVRQPQVNVQPGVNAAEYGGGYAPAGQHAVGLGAEDAAPDNVVGNKGLRSGVVERLILGKGGVDQVKNFRRELLRHTNLTNRKVTTEPKRRLSGSSPP